MKLDLQIKIIDDKDSSVIQQERIVRNINTATAKETGFYTITVRKDLIS